MGGMIFCKGNLVVCQANIKGSQTNNSVNVGPQLRENVSWETGGGLLGAKEDPSQGVVQSLLAATPRPA